MTTQLDPLPSSPTPPADAPAAPGRLLRLIGAAPKRTLLAVFLFVLVAGFFGGPVAGSLESGGGFATSNADSVRAIERIETATGRDPSAGIVLLVDTPDGLPADADRVAEVTAGPRGRARHHRRLLADQHPRRPRGPGVDRRQPGARARHARGQRGRRPGRGVRPRHLRRPGRRHRRRVGRDRRPARHHRRRGPRPGRDDGLPDPDPAVAALLPGPRRADAAAGRGHHGARHLPGAHRRQPALRRERLRAQPGHRARARPGHRLHAVPGHPLPRGARGPGTDPGRDRHHDAHRRSHRGLLGDHRRGRPGRAHDVPPRLHQVDGPGRRDRRGRRRRRGAGDLAGDVRPLGRQAGPQGARPARGGRPLVPPLARRDAPSRRRRDRDRRGHARPGRPRAAGRVDPVDSSVIPTDKSSRTVADTVRVRLRGHRWQPDDDRGQHGRSRRRRGRRRRTPSGSARCQGS